MRIGKALAEFIFPMNAVCTGCGDVTGADADGLCDACAQQLERLRLFDMEGRCPLCLAPIGPGVCQNCELLAGWVGRASYAFAYRDPAARIVRRFKYNSEGALDAWMAQQMLLAPGAEALIGNCDVLVCVPSDMFRRSRRGYNQAYLLAKELSKLSSVPVRDVLKRRPLVRHQAKLDRKRRLSNLEGVISCAADMKGMRVLLIDDVRTTGATAVACARALKAAGAAQVELLTFAASD